MNETTVVTSILQNEQLISKLEHNGLVFLIALLFLYIMYQIDLCKK